MIKWHDVRQNLFDKPERRDESLVGITFIDVLFALVVSQILIPIANGLAIPDAGKAQLVLAFLLTVTSWIGYHNSWNRPRFFIRFFNLPLAQFSVDVLLVIIYWIAATWVEGLPLESQTASALPEAVCVALTFLLYAIWDRIGLKMRQSDRYAGRPLSRDVPARRDVTGNFFLLSLATGAIVYLTSPQSSTMVIVLDVWLIALILLFRVAKEAVTPVAARRLPADQQDDDG